MQWALNMYTQVYNHIYKEITHFDSIMYLLFIRLQKTCFKYNKSVISPTLILYRQ